MEEIKNEEIVKVSETKQEETNSTVNQGKREFRPRTPRPPRKENGETSQNGNSTEQAHEKKPPFKKKKPNNKPRFINKDIPTAGDGWTNDLKSIYDK